MVPFAIGVRAAGRAHKLFPYNKRIPDRQPTCVNSPPLLHLHWDLKRL